MACSLCQQDSSRCISSHVLLGICDWLLRGKKKKESQKRKGFQSQIFDSGTPTGKRGLTYLKLLWLSCFRNRLLTLYLVLFHMLPKQRRTCTCALFFGTVTILFIMQILIKVFIIIENKLFFFYICFSLLILKYVLTPDSFDT